MALVEGQGGDCQVGYMLSRNVSESRRAKSRCFSIKFWDEHFEDVAENAKKKVEHTKKVWVLKHKQTPLSQTNTEEMGSESV